MPDVNNHKENDSFESLDLRELLGVFIDGRRTIALLIIIFFIGSKIYTFFQVPIYKANSLILIQNEPSAVSSFENVSPFFSESPSTSNEIQIIKSRSVIGSVVDELNLTVHVSPSYLPIIGKQFFGKVPSGSLNDPFYRVPGYAYGGEIIEVKSFELPKKFINQKFDILYEGDQRYSLWYQDKKILESDVGSKAQSSDGLIEIELSEILAYPKTRFTIVKKPRLNVILNLSNRILVNNKGQNTDLIEISINGKNKKTIKNILNSTLANYYIQNVTRMSTQAENSIEFLNEQIPIIKKQLVIAEEALNLYRSQQNTVDLSLETSSTLNGLVETETKIVDLKMNEADISRRFTKQHPTYISYQRQLANLEDQKNRLTNKLNQLPETQKTILQLQRDFEVNQAIYISLENKRQEFSILKASTVGNVTILDDAVVLPKKISPKNDTISTIGIFLGLFFSLSFLVLRHYLNSALNSPKALTDNGYMVLATIPQSEIEADFEKDNRSKKIKVKNMPLLALKHPADLTIEALRSLRTSLHFSMLDAKNNIVMITSANPNAGKSFITSNLAAVSSQTDKKVILIDADMRKGFLHRRFNISNKLGLSEYLSGVASIDEIIKSTSSENLDLITRGSIPSNPSEILMSENLNNCLNELSSKYDLVLIDTPPILAVTDPAIIGRYSGTSIMIARYGSCSIKQINNAVERFDNNGVVINGFVFNAVERKASNYYYDYGYYNYEYK